MNREQLALAIKAYVTAWTDHSGPTEAKRQAALEAAARAVNVPLHVISRLEVQPA